MGNCFRRIRDGYDSESDTPAEHYPGHYSRNGYGGHVVGLKAFSRDLKEFQTTIEVPKALSHYVSASRTSQRLWFFRLLVAWKRENPAPTSAEDVAQLILQTVQGYSNIRGLLKFYHLPWPIVPYALPVPVPATQPLLVPAGEPYWERPEASGTWLVTPEAAEEIEYEIHTLPVKWKKDKGDGDGLTVFVNVLENARETKLLPKEIHDAVLLRQKARSEKNCNLARALRKQINETADYKVVNRKNGGAWCLVRKYRIRLRGVDAPEIEQPYGEEARDLLRGLVKDQQLLIRVYCTDKYERKVGDIYCNGIFIQEVLLKSGSVWHYKYFDKRGTFAEWHRAAKEACIGLWANPNPEAPWNFRKRLARMRIEDPFRIRGA